MFTIHLFCTVHREYGRCTPEALCSIIERVVPDVIFEELSQANFDYFYHDHAPANLETNAIKLYLERHVIPHIPVDTYDLPPGYEDQLSLLYTKVMGSDGIPACRQLHTILVEEELSMALDGFDYLNSSQHDAVMKTKGMLIEQVLAVLGDDSLNAIYALEQEVIAKREIEMLTTLYRYSRAHPYGRALFFIGSGHRTSLVQKIIEFEEGQELKLNWLVRDYDQFIPLFGLSSDPL